MFTNAFYKTQTEPFSTEQHDLGVYLAFTGDYVEDFFHF